MSDSAVLREGLLYLPRVSLGQDGISSLHVLHSFNTCWSSQSQGSGGVEGRHDEAWAIDDCHVFV